MRATNGRWIHELRAYDLRPGAGPDYLALFLRHGIGPVTRHLPLAGYWLTDTGALNRLYHLWIYADLDERAAARTVLAADREWTEGFVPRGFPLILRQRNMLMRRVGGTTAVAAVEAARRTHHPCHEGPLFAETAQCLTAGPVAAEAAPVARWRVVSGEAPGRELALWHGDGLGFAERYDRHEVLRPVACSPLR